MDDIGVAERRPREATVLSVAFGMLLAVVFGAANAYLGLKVGMTVSAGLVAGEGLAGLVLAGLALAGCTSTGIMVDSQLGTTLAAVCLFGALGWGCASFRR